MSRPLSVALGERRSMPVLPPRQSLANAIQREFATTPGASGPRFGATALCAALTLALLPAGQAAAAVISVDSSATTVAVDGACTLPEAVDNANDNAATHADCVAGEAGLDSIVFDGALAASTITLDDELDVGDALAVDGAAAAGLAISGAGSYRIFDADAPLAVSNLVLMDGYADGEGGAIRAYQTLTVTNVDFVGNAASDDGGAISANGELVVTGSSFDGNQAYGDGGAILAFGNLTVTDSSFDNNRSDKYYGAIGGAIAARGNQTTITGSTFSDNQVRGAGGAVAMQPRSGFLPPPTGKGVITPQNQQLSIVDSQFLRNAAEGAKYQQAFGGAVWFSPAHSGDGSLSHTLEVSGSELRQNIALPDLGATRAKGGPGESYSVGGGIALISDNGGNGPQQKGAPVSDAVTANIDDTIISGNFAFFAGGALLGASSVTVSDSAIDDNAAALVGGAAMFEKYSKYSKYSGAPNGTVTLQRSSFSGNAATAIGGVLAGGGTLSIADSSFDDNIAGTPSYAAPVPKGVGFPLPTFECGGGKYLGGAALFAATDLTISGASTFSRNCAGDVAGASLSIGPGATGSIAGSVLFADNSADDRVGGVELDAADGAQLLFQATVSGNSAGAEAGGVLASAYDTGAITLQAATIAGNSTDGMGGGLVIGSGNVTVVQSTISSNSAAGAAGVLVEAGPQPPPPPLAKGSTPVAVVFENSTIHGNQALGVPAPVAKGLTPLAPDGGGVLLGAGASAAMRFVTIASNSAAGDGGGLWVDPTATATIDNSIVGDNAAAGSGNDIFGTVTANYTLVESVAGATIGGANNATGVDPLLGALADNGGPTLTQLPLPGSPAIDSGDPAFAPPPATDQRGAGFPRVLGIVDKGAVEQQLVNVIGLQIAPTPFAEGGSSTLTVTLDGVAGWDVYATVVFSGVASAGVDFTAEDDDLVAPGIQVLVPAGSGSGSIGLTALADGTDESDEGLTATVSAATDAGITGTVSGNAVITDGDVPTVTLSLLQTVLLEESGSTEVVATLSQPAVADVLVTLSLSGTATNGVDYSIGDDDAGAGVQILIPAGSLSGSVTLATIDDPGYEGNETVVIDIASVTNAAESGAQQVTATIDDSADQSGGGTGNPPPNPSPELIPTLSEWMLMLLGLLLPATVVGRLRRDRQGAQRRV